MFSIAGRDGFLPTISAYLHIKRLTPVSPCIVKETLGKINSMALKFFLSSAISALKFRRTMSDLPHSFHGGVVVPIDITSNRIDILVCILILLSLIDQSPYIFMKVIPCSV